jgi:SlyX protein
VSDLAKLEETLAHLLRTVEELSDVVARQDAEIARLTARVRDADDPRGGAGGGRGWDRAACRQAAAALVSVVFSVFLER